MQGREVSSALPKGQLRAPESEKQEGFGEQEGLTQRRVGRLPQGHLRRKGKWGASGPIGKAPQESGSGPLSAMDPLWSRGPQR